MERRRHARTPVNINAMLIGQKTVPKGCRVRNISQQGMLLQCEPDGRLLTFSKGDKVEIHLTVEYASEKKSLTIPSSVRHVNEAYIYVEFQHPDLKLVELIESYRVSEAHALEATVGYGDSRPAGAKETPLTDTADTETTMQADAQQMPETEDTHRPFYFGLLTLVLAICIITGGYIYTASVDTRLGMLESITDKQSTELSEMRERVFSSTLQEGRYASLNARMKALTDAFSSLENKLTQLIAKRLPNTPAQLTPATSGDSPILITTQMRTRTENAEQTTARPAVEAPKPAITTEQAEAPLAATEANTEIAAQPTVHPATKTDVVAPLLQTITTARPISESVSEAGGTTEETVAETPAGQASTASQKTASKALASRTSASQQGPWVINLLSSTDKGYVEQYAARARSRDVAVELHSAEVKGKTYWRLQITGFSTANAAKAGSQPIKKKLGISDVWIFRR